MEHTLERRSFLQSMLTGAGATLAFASGMGGTLLGNQAVADQLKSGRKRILNIFLHGGVSQLESWDPKPNTDTGGPFRAIPTSVPGMHISELLPIPPNRCIIFHSFAVWIQRMVIMVVARLK